MKREALLAVVALTLSLAPVSLAHHHALIQPGMAIIVPNGGCTLGLILVDAGGALYSGTAAHCVNVVGTRATAEGVGGFATVVEHLYHADDNDFALLRIDADKAALVDPAMRGSGGPVGVATAFPPGARLIGHGYGAGAGAVEPTRSREGVLVGSDGNGWYAAVYPTTPGDSGAPLLTSDGLAVGVVSSLRTTPGRLGTVTGPTYAYVLDELAARGYALQVVTAPLDADDPGEIVAHCAAAPLFGPHSCVL